VEEKKVSSYHVSKKLMLQERDMDIFSFLDRVGYANVEQISRFFFKGDEKHQATLLRRLHLLRRFGYVKSFNTHMGVYFALALKGKGDNALIKNIKLDQLKHHDFLTDLFFVCMGGFADVLSERECITQFKVVGRKGHVPDMIVNDWIIEYERTSKSVPDSKAMAYYWLYEQKRQLCIIYDTEEIRKRYSEFLGADVVLISKKDCESILGRLKSHKSDNTHREEILKKYGAKPIQKVEEVTLEVITTSEVKNIEEHIIASQDANEVKLSTSNKWGNSEDIISNIFSKIKGLSGK
jgi:hypothetical protein